jgi:excisionase family DNA binding protein
MGEEKQAGEEVMDYRGLAAYMKIAYGTLRHYVMTRQIPFIKVGARVLFYKKDIDVWLEKKSREPGEDTVPLKTNVTRGDLFTQNDEGKND